MKADWEVKKLGEVCDFQGGAQPPKDEWIKNYKNGYVRMLQIRDFTQSRNFDIEYVKITNKLRRCTTDDILLGRYGASVGKVLTGLEGAYNVAILKTIPSEIIQKMYIKYYFLSPLFQIPLLNLCNQRAAQAGFNREDISDFPIPVPPLAEQKRIVEILDQKFAQIDQLKQNAEKNLQNAKELFQTELTKAFSNNTWEKKRLQDCTSIIGDGLHGTPKYDENGNYYFINGSNLTVRDIVFTPETKRVNETEYQKYKVKLNENTVFISINGSTLGKRTAFYNNEPVILGKSACYINVKENTLNKFYLRYFFSSNIFQEYAWKEKTGTAIPNLGLKAMRDLQIPLPPLSEQQEIVAHLDVLQEKVRQLEEIYTKQIANCDELKQSFLKKAFEGEL